MSDPKEPFFFEAEYEKGVQYYLDNYFSNVQRNQYTGEARHRNLLLPYIPRRISKVVENPKFVAVLRNPLDRTFSHWWHWFARGVETRTFHEVVSLGIQGGEFYGLSNEELEREYPGELLVNRHGHGYSRYEAYVASSRYAEQLERYLDLFGKENVLIVFYEDLISEPVEVVRNIWEFLELDTDKDIFLETAQKNSASNLRATRWVKRLKSVPGSFLVPSGLRKKFVSAINSAVGKDDYRIERKKNLRRLGADLSNYFMEDVHWLERQTGRDLSAWREWE